MQPKIRKRNRTLVIELPFGSPRKSASGKTRVVASTHGRLITALEYRGKPIVVVASAYFYPNGAEWKKRKGMSGKPSGATQD